MATTKTTKAKTSTRRTAKRSTVKNSARKKNTTAKNTAARKKSTAAKKTTAKKSPAKKKVLEAASKTVTINRRHEDRRKADVPVAIERRAKVTRRRQIDPTTCERDYSVDELEFMIALDEYKRTSGRMFPTCSEVLEVLLKLGYEKQLQSAEVVAEVSIPEINVETTISEMSEEPVLEEMAV